MVVGAVGVIALAGPSGVVSAALLAGIQSGSFVGAISGSLARSAGIALQTTAAASATAGGLAGMAATNEAMLLGAATGAASGAVSGTIIASILSGSVGWSLLGTAVNSSSESPYTFDCWKQIVRDKTTEPSQGMFLKDIARDDRVKSITQQIENEELFLIFENIWNEKFRVNFLYLLPTFTLAAHATKI